MEFISKPVISCAGDENLLPYFENHCLGTLASHQVTWKHPKLSVVHSVRLEACFTRFRVDQLQSNVKVLSSGRPIQPVGTFQPLLYIYVISSNVSHYTSQGGRNIVGSWLGHLRARNVFDWLIVMVNSDPQYNTPKILQKSNVLDKIKSDFNVRTGDRQFLEVPAPNSVDERLFSESWIQLTYLIRKAIISACMSIIVDYDVHLQMLADSRSSFTWDYFEYLDRKEELAHMYLFLGGHEHALHEYYEATELLFNCIQDSKDQGSKRPSWLSRLIQASSSYEASRHLCDYSLDVTNTEVKQTGRLKYRNATLFELRNYLLSRQASILCICDRLYEFPAYTYRVICSTLSEISILNIQTDSLFYAIWILCICLNTLTNIRLDSNRSMDDMNKSIIEVLDLAFSCNNILENINFIHLSKRLLVNVNNSPASLNHYSSTTQCILLDANKELNPTVWYISHLVDKIYTHFHSYQNQILRRSSIAPFIYNNNNNGIIGNNNSNNNNNPITTEISSKFSSKHKSTMSRDEKDTYWTESYAVELWLCIFNYIKRIGQMIGLWCKKPNSYHYEKLSLFNKIITSNLNKQSVSSIFNISSDYQKNKEEEEEEEEEESVDQLNFQTNKQNEIIYQDNSLLLAHYHLIPLFNSSIIYSQIFSAIGETLIGFLKLIHNPRRSYEIVFDLADFMFSQGAYESASWLYESIINFFDESSWIGLITSARLCLAWCLHFLCIEKQYETKTDCEIARKYIQVCLTLSGICQPVLHTAADYVYSKIRSWYHGSDINEILRIPKYTDTVNPNYWWMEAIEFRKSLSAFHQSIVTDPYDMSSLFCLKSVELEGVCDCGYQLIYAVLESNSERHFKASVHITASEPSYVDWQTLLNPNEFLPYHVMNKTNQSLTSHSESQLHIINLTTLPSFSITNNNLIDNANSSVTVVNNDNNNHKVSLRSQLSIPSGTGSQLHLEQINKYLLPASTTVSTCRSYSNIPDSSKEYKYTTLSVVGNPLNNTGINIRSKFDTRLGSLLNVAASLASKPAWRSQDIMEMVNDEHNAAVSIRDTEQFLQRMGKTSRITSDGFIDPVVSRTPQVTRRYSLHQTKKRSCYSFSINSKHDIFGNENDKSTVVSTKKPLFLLRCKGSFVQIKPGRNKILFVANVPGFLIPERLFIICYDDNDNDDDFVTADQYSDKSTIKQSTALSVNATEVHFVSDIDSDHFGPNWRNVELMQTLLPKPEIVVSSNNLDKLYPVVFGTCQPIPVQLRLGKLGLPNDCKLSTSLYRIRPNSKYPNNKREYPYYNAAVTSITNSNDENDIANNSTFTNGVSLGNISYANDYSLISSKPESEEKNTHPNNDSNALINRAIFNQFILEDGPADFVRDSNSFKLQHNLCKINHPMPTYPPGCCLQLSRPLYLSADSCSDQFALSMPSGHYCVLLLNIIKPLAFKLNIFPLPTTYIIFSLHIACVDTDPDSIISPEIYCSLEKPCKEPVTFELSNMRFYIVASKFHSYKSLILHNSSSDHQRYLSKSGSSPPTKEGGSQQVTGTVDILFDNTEETRIESLNGDLIDNKLTKAYINHLTPFSIPWRFKSLEYNNFLKACKEFHYKPVGRFECTMNRIDAIKIDQEIRVDCHIEQQI